MKRSMLFLTVFWSLCCLIDFISISISGSRMSWLVIVELLAACISASLIPKAKE